MTLTATEQKNLIEFGNASRDFSEYIYHPTIVDNYIPVTILNKLDRSK